MKGFVNVTCFSARRCKHYSYFYRIRFNLSLDSVPAKNQWSCSENSCQLRTTFPVKQMGLGGLQRAVDISLQGKTITFSPSTRRTLMTPCDNHQTVYVILITHTITLLWTLDYIIYIGLYYNTYDTYCLKIFRYTYVHCSMVATPCLWLSNK